MCYLLRGHKERDHDDIPVETALPLKTTQAAWPRTRGGPHLVTLSDAVRDGLQLRHDLLILEVVREGLRPLLQQLHNLGREGLQLGLGQWEDVQDPQVRGDPTTATVSGYPSL